MTLSRRLGASGLCLALAACAAGPPPTRQMRELHGPTMGTTWSVKVVTTPVDAPDLAALETGIETVLARVNALMSTWDSASELSRFNQSRTLDAFAVSPETFEVFRWSRDVGALTGGAFDVTVAPLLDAWGFGPAGPHDRPPSDEEIERLRARVGMGLLELDEATTSVRKRHPEVQAEFSALAPGYAVDRLWDLLIEAGVGNFLVDVGGELRARGTNDAGRPWQIAIERPSDQGRAIERIVPIADAAVATSGDYRNYYEVDGVRLTHILDPRTGRPVRHRLASVTVIDDLAVRADALSTALMVLGEEDGPALAERLGLAALFLVRAGDGDAFIDRSTPAFDAVAASGRTGAESAP